MTGMHGFYRGLRRLATLAVALALAAPAWAQSAADKHGPRPWEIGMQPAGGPIESRIQGLNHLLTWIICAIVVFVAGLIGYVIWKFRASVNPKASRVSHHTSLEVAWTLVPVLILVVIAIPSFRLMYYENRAQDPDMTIKATGHQWYWEYTYPDQGGLHYDSYMIQADQLQPGQIRQLDVDNELVVPAGKSIRVLTTSADVIHSFFIPSLGVQRYAIPGRLIETWFQADKPGIYYGECNQICGTNHSAMPIAVRALSEPDFKAWLDQAKTKFAEGGTAFSPDAPRAVAEATR